MSLEVILEKIRDSAVAESRSIEDQAEAKARQQLDEARAEADKVLSKARAETERKLDSMTRSRLASVKRDLKLELLRAENMEVEQVFSSVLRRLSAFSSEEKRDYYLPFLEKAKGQVDGFYIHCSRTEGDLFSSLEPSMEVISDLDTIGGFVLENRDETIRVDYTFEHLLREIKESVQEDLRSILFEK